MDAKCPNSNLQHIAFILIKQEGLLSVQNMNFLTVGCNSDCDSFYK